MDQHSETDQTSPPPLPARSSSAPSTRSTILIVEDDVDQQALLTRLIDTKLGQVLPDLHIIITDRVSKALEILKQTHQQILLVISDGNLADTPKPRTANDFSQTGITVITAAHDHGVPHVLFNSGDQELVAKVESFNLVRLGTTKNSPLGNQAIQAFLKEIANKITEALSAPAIH